MTDEDSQRLADRLFDAMNSLDSKTDFEWAHHPKHFLPANVTTDYAGERGLKNLLARTLKDNV